MRTEGTARKCIQNPSHTNLPAYILLERIDAHAAVLVLVTSRPGLFLTQQSSHENLDLDGDFSVLHLISHAFGPYLWVEMLSAVERRCDCPQRTCGKRLMQDCVSVVDPENQSSAFRGLNLDQKIAGRARINFSNSLMVT